MGREEYAVLLRICSGLAAEWRAAELASGQALAACCGADGSIEEKDLDWLIVNRCEGRLLGVGLAIEETVGVLMEGGVTIPRCLMECLSCDDLEVTDER